VVLCKIRVVPWCAMSTRHMLRTGHLALEMNLLPTIVHATLSTTGILFLDASRANRDSSFRTTDLADP